MRTLLALFVLCASASADDFRWAVEVPFFDWTLAVPEGGDASPSNDSAVSGKDARSFVHRINAANRGGSATCIAPGVFVTCKHVFEGLRGYQVSIDGQAVEATVELSPTHDVAVVRLQGDATTELTQVGKFALGSPEYMAECVAFGFGSETLHRGVISNDDTLSLYADQGTIEQGDSGGAVFCNGVLIGVIRGKNPNNGKVCYFTPLKSVAALVAPFSPDAASPAAPGADDNAVQKPAITINLADFPCPPCETLKGYDWSEFNVTWETGGAESYPQISWTDKRGVKRVLTGAYTPRRVMWSYRETAK